MKLKGIVIGVLLLSHSAFSINYPAKKGEGHIGISYKTTTYSSVYDLDGEKKYSPKATSSQYILTGNYGLSDKFNISLFAPINIQNKAKTGSGNEIKYNGPGDMELGIGYSFTEQKKLIATATLKQSLGFGKHNQEYGLNTGFGDYATSMYFDLHYQLNTHLFFAGSVGARKRNKGLSDDFSGEALAGWHILPSLDLTGSINGLFPFDNGKENIADVYYGYGLYRNKTGYMIANATLNYNYNRTFGVALEFNSYLKGQLIGTEPIIGVKLYYIFKAKEKTDDKQSVPETTPEKK
jgi:hypothetical protein